MRWNERRRARRRRGGKSRCFLQRHVFDLARQPDGQPHQRRTRLAPAARHGRIVRLRDIARQARDVLRRGEVHRRLPDGGGGGRSGRSRRRRGRRRSGGAGGVGSGAGAAIGDGAGVTGIGAGLGSAFGLSFGCGFGCGTGLGGWGVGGDWTATGIGAGCGVSLISCAVIALDSTGRGGASCRIVSTVPRSAA